MGSGTAWNEGIQPGLQWAFLIWIFYISFWNRGSRNFQMITYEGANRYECTVSTNVCLIKCSYGAWLVQPPHTSFVVGLLAASESTMKLWDLRALLSLKAHILTTHWNEPSKFPLERNLHRASFICPTASTQNAMSKHFCWVISVWVRTSPAHNNTAHC